MKGCAEMDYMSARQAADKWGISQRRVAVLCSEKRISQATMLGNMWIIPVSAEKPVDARSTRYIDIDETKVKPFLKWAGGKGQLIKEIEKFYPFENKNITKYAEPFVGGGAILFDILNKFDLEEIYISDINSELINTYIAIRDSVEKLICLLKKYQEEFIPLETEYRKVYYSQKRDKYNFIKTNKNPKDDIELASLTIFLNRTCFNGLYRVNKKGFFNVPMGSYKNPMICDEKNLRSVSKKLQKVEIVCGDYALVEDFVDEKTFVYLDPPYRPLTQTASFTSYTESSFTDEQQIELAEFMLKLSKKGAKVLVSNSDPKNVDENDSFFDELYSNFNIKRVGANRMISCKTESRKKIKELLINNF